MVAECAISIYTCCEYSSETCTESVCHYSYQRPEEICKIVCLGTFKLIFWKKWDHAVSLWVISFFNSVNMFVNKHILHINVLTGQFSRSLTGIRYLYSNSEDMEELPSTWSNSFCLFLLYDSIKIQVNSGPIKWLSIYIPL